MSYLVTMAFGVVVGVVVNLVVVPPLRVKKADDRLSRLRDALGEVLRAMSSSLAGRSFDPEAADRAAADLEGTLVEVREEVDLADESRRYNPRATFEDAARPGSATTRRLDGHGRRDPRARSRSGAAHRGPRRRHPPAGDARRLLADAIETVSRLVTTPPEPQATAGELRAAETALTRYTESLRSLDAQDEPLDAWEAAVSLRRVIAACGPFSDPDADTAAR